MWSGEVKTQGNLNEPQGHDSLCLATDSNDFNDDDEQGEEDGKIPVGWA